MTVVIKPSRAVAAQRSRFLQREQSYALQARLAPDFWRLYASSFLIDLGLCLYFFMFSLFLVEHRFTEQNIGLITASLTVGALAGILPASLLARRFGLRAMMLAFVSVAPVCFALRTMFLQVPAQLGLAFLAGIATSIWSVCFSPTLAKLTTQDNRAFGFSLFVATGIASGALGGFIGGYLPGLIGRSHLAASHVDGVRIVLLMASATIALAAITLSRLSIGTSEASRRGTRIFNRFLLRFMMVSALWNFSISFFTPFANVFLSRHLQLPLTRIGTIFSISQLVQVAAVMIAPILYRKFGLVGGIAITQACTAITLLVLSQVSRTSTAIGAYLLLTALQWMGGPGLSSLLMNRTREEDRSQASAMQNMVNLAAQAGSAALAGWMFGHYGYSGPLAANGLLAALAATLLYQLLRDNTQDSKTGNAVESSALDDPLPNPQTSD